MNAFWPLFAADFGDLIQVVIVVIVVLAAGIRQLMTKWREVQKEMEQKMRGQGPPGGARPGGARPGGAPAGGAQAGGARPRDAVEDEIGEFLRRAAQARSQAREARPQQPPPQRRPPKPVYKSPTPAAAEIVEAQEVHERSLGEGVVKHVESHLDSRDIVEHAESLGVEVAREDQRLEERLRDVFDHQVSRLGRLPDEAAGRESEPAPPAAGAELPVTAAAGFAALLADAESLREAIVLNEILRRPEDRW